MTRTLEIQTTEAEPQTLHLTTEDDEPLTMTKLQTMAASLLPDKTEFSLRYTDSDGDQVTITTDADVDELAKYMHSEQLQTLQVFVYVVPRQPPTAQRAATAVQTQLRGLVTAMSKLTAQPDVNPTPISTMNLLVAGLQAMDVAEDAGELATIKKELLLVLQDEELRKAVEELSAAEEFKELAHAMMTAIYAQDAQAIEDATTARFDELLVFAQHVLARCPALKPVVVNVAKSLMAGLVRYNDEDVVGVASDSSSCSSSSSSCCSDDHETVDVEVFAQEVPLHLGVVCAGCGIAPLAGVRYKSLEVRNFDLCEDCEASGNYMRFEPFIKITDPSRAPKQKRMSEIVHPYVTCDGCEMSPIVGARFKSDTKDDFDLCEACEASGKWTESHGPFTKMEEPGMMRALKFACRRGAKFGHHGKFGHHHGHDHHGKFGHHHGHDHHGKFGRHHGHDHHGKFGRHHGKHGRRHGCQDKFDRRHDDRHGKFGHGGRHHGHHGKFGCHGHRHGPPDVTGFAFHGPPFPGHGPPFSGHGGPRGFPGHGPPFRHEDRSGFPGHGRPDIHEHLEFGPPGFFGHFGRFGPSPFDSADPRGPPTCPRDFEHGRPPFAAHHDFRRHHGRHTRFSDDDEEQREDRCHRRCHVRGRGRWGHYAADKEENTTQDNRQSAPRNDFETNENMEVVDTADVRVESDDGNAAANETEDKADYVETLAQLASMGFDDAEKNIRALELANGNIGEAVNVLLSE
ncbi:ZZ-type zinc finger-containing protein P35G2.11c [Phytophthora cinnamomi]|uniref:ZZ-type zinc finger-containing protein P35G2.11c n=1 Tax=Phytophthora cinnamomi TaxID=4785 RepID=UPI00355ABFDE|nr:ZZ-type zinc finger-containing protein P35G2.11c [Phytophthora cinnamomi]